MGRQFNLHIAYFFLLTLPLALANGINQTDKTTLVELNKLFRLIHLPVDFFHHCARMLRQVHRCRNRNAINAGCQ